MKKIKFILPLLLSLFFVKCTSDKQNVNLDAVSNPTNIDARIVTKADNSGQVSISPTGERITQFEIYFGDGTTAPTTLAAGTTTEHTFLEGTFQLKIVGKTLNGKQSEKIIPLTISFFAPTDLVATIAPIPTNSLGITVKASANFEKGFKVFYGESPTETPDNFLEGETVSHTYTNPGTYAVKVVATTGGIAKSEVIKNVTVTIPVIIGLPLTFESATLPYTFNNFGGANTVVETNSKSGGINTSTKVAALTKTNGSQVWAGSFIELTNPINFSTQKKIKIKVWSPQSGIIVKMKLENLSNSNINIEKDVTLTVANGWQELTFDFTGISLSDTFQRVVVFFNFGNAGNGSVYYFDDISQSN